MDKDTDKSSLGFPQLDRLRWRVDVTISSNHLARVLQPSILMEMTLSDGSIKTFEVSVEQFHALRHAVARSIHEMEALEPKLEQVAEMERRVERRTAVVKADSLLKKSGYVGGRGG
mmetsp:Transcript_3669/g.7591  ORF Transcript_3669/g.7591 Transcript_3669/m.7591 type:complete len:116 (+) Transcript_3669:317-664(+)|eukprot:CAMPEP_0118922038 /NCGR_PEP_ID=MMETSP1169-20130426/1109_1 /TAXON_ID=36882 /ORGANISM="Pyramimonas obovata, Strain CCMP722" /LENGTH=115 /DNA_ID=CAMNT_0006862851 /DNA_START=298 /DNA_END=645 /DNA_ORIENTATION=+